MLRTGLVSISFRQLTPEQIIELVCQAQMQAIEWGGDVHVPHGNYARAVEVGERTRNAGLNVSAYGSYYRLGVKEEPSLNFEQVLESAVGLQAKSIRVWAGNRGTAEADEEWWEKVVLDAQQAADLAKKENISLSFEFHRNTLTDHASAAIELIERVNRDNVFSFWQPPIEETYQERMNGLKKMVPWLTSVHIYHWNGIERLPLADGTNDWLRYLSIVLGTKKPHDLMLEFVRGDQPEQFLQDAQTLLHMITELQFPAEESERVGLR